jgi:uncharacterized protein YciI
VPHKESIRYLQKSSLLLVCGPLNKDQKEGGIPAKVYEYLAARKPIIYIGKVDGFVAHILEETVAGQSFDTDVPAITAYLNKVHEDWQSGKAILPENKAVLAYSRPLQASRFKDLLV